MTTTLTRRRRDTVVPIEVEVLAQESGLHPDLVRRLLRLGALDPFPRDAAARLARIARLRRDLGLNFAGALLACELLDRIAELEEMLWTRTS